MIIENINKSKGISSLFLQMVQLINKSKWISLRAILTIVLLLPIFVLDAQEYKEVTGRVVDSSTGKELPHASVQLNGSTISIISNAEGVFTLKVPSSVSDDANITVKHLGYKATSVKISDLFQKRRRISEVELVPESINLSAVTVYPDDALALFNAAFNREAIKKNYSTERVGMSGFYRELIKRGNRYITLNEAILDVSKAPYATLSNDMSGIYKGRGSENAKSSDTLFLKLRGGIYSSMQLDLAKNPFVATDLISAPDFYDFIIGASTAIDGEPVYTLHFNQKPDVKEALFRGTLYISSESLAIVRAEFTMNVEGFPEAWRRFVNRKSSNVDLEVESANYLINYKKYGEKWFYDYSRIEIGFKAKYDGKLLKSKYSIMSEFAVTDLDNKNALKIAYRDRISFKDILSTKVNDFNDDEFWGSYNTITPDESIEDIIAKIIRQLKRRD